MPEPTHVGIYEDARDENTTFYFYAGTPESLPRKLMIPLETKRVRLLEMPRQLREDITLVVGSETKPAYVGYVEYACLNEPDGTRLAASGKYQPKISINRAKVSAINRVPCRKVRTGQEQRIFDKWLNNQGQLAKGFGSFVEEHCLRRLRRAGVTHARITRAPEMPRRNQVTEKYRLPIGTPSPIDDWINAVSRRNKELGFKRTPRQQRQSNRQMIK